MMKFLTEDQKFEVVFLTIYKIGEKVKNDLKTGNDDHTSEWIDKVVEICNTPFDDLTNILIEINLKS